VLVVVVVVVVYQVSLLRVGINVCIVSYCLYPRCVHVVR
jgi:hypothetical protein